MYGSNQWGSAGQVRGLIPCDLGASRRCCKEKAGVAARLLPAAEAPSEVTCNSRGWLNNLQPVLLSGGAYWILLIGKEAYGDSAPHLGSSVNCPKQRWMAAALGKAIRLLRERGKKLWAKQHKSWIRLSLGHLCHPLKTEALWDHVRWKDREEPGTLLRNKSCILVPFSFHSKIIGILLSRTKSN